MSKALDDDYDGIRVENIVDYGKISKDLAIIWHLSV
ncbi:hypothetical protein CGSMWGv00703Dmash_01680 [Gardnerella greenwoodii 00703Dmash]|uniref:Uncharacterized protein n=1 Tax=Gardnerella greenwoodii 00703Dmash TaxID=698960 RepID=I4MBI6_9BIFI|nr:hypothetical protein CGSMWGv00703Dmash_01680 [Gardnerella greenwoodii 00703Dmash]